MQNVVGQPQTVQVPNYSGVNIQIFNPAVNVPAGGQTVTAPNVQTVPACYPGNYYTQNYGPAPQATANATATATINQVPAAPQQPAQSQTQTQTQTAPAEPADKKKTEKRQIVQLTDDYIRNVENYLNSQNPEIRLMGAKEVVARLEEDNSRKGDAALNALVNKMLQDPSTPVKFLAMAALEARMATGNDLTVQLLKGIQQQNTGYGQDALKASNILLKMSGQTVEKEFEVKNPPKQNNKKESEKA